MPELTQEDHFASAADRHFRDADYLHTDGRLPAADHLYGFAAECASKSLLLRFTDVTMAPRPGEDKPSSKPWADHPDDPDQVIEFGHVNELIREIKLLSHGRTGAPLHAALDSDLRAFRRWRVSHRYLDGGYAQAQVVERRRDAARNILSLHEQARLNGRLP
ncbi:hypothetical protein [Streptomyces thermolilacinus]|uniref:hypothetical protein n=1 Tax=Streptomyces thermolilacinus TaxID=285540 RepID=UPI0033D83D93